MKIHIVSIFPESFSSYFSSSIMKNAISKWLFELEFYKLNDFSDNKFKRVDDKAYWTHWQVISPEPLAKVIEYIFDKVGKKISVLYLTPSWDLLNQEKIEEFYEKLWDEFLVICWHYEWIDQRIVELFVDYKISIWEYVVSSWELATSVFIDALVRNIPWVLWNKISLEEESFSKKLSRQKEYPVYTKPNIFLWKKVPEILLSWNHKEIEKWKKKNLS
jgi:tRNA (guanine37-N1)-methyltransferase